MPGNFLGSLLWWTIKSMGVAGFESVTVVWDRRSPLFSIFYGSHTPIYPRLLSPYRVTSTTTVSRTGAHRLAHQSLLVDALTHLEYLKASQHPADTIQSQQPSMHLTRPIQHHHPSSQLANEYPSKSSRAPARPKLDTENKACVRLPPASRHHSPPLFVQC